MLAAILTIALWKLSFAFFIKNQADSALNQRPVVGVFASPMILPKSIEEGVDILA
jgi:hypothetical protein